MAGTTVSARETGMSGSDVYYLRRTVNLLIDDLEATRAAIAGNQTLINQLRYTLLYNTYGNPGFLIKTNFDVENATAFFYSNNGTLKTKAANSTWDTGTAKTITTATWSSALLTITSGAANVVTWAASSYASEALAIAALPAAPNATDNVVGYITVLAAGSTWTAGTDALAGGTGGTPATTTNYYNSVNGNAAMIGAALTTTTVDLAADLLAYKVANQQGTTT